MQVNYYPYGLKIAGISSKAFDAPKNPYQYQGDYAEYDDETQWNDFELRNYDPQIGRFVQTDPYDQFASPYVGMAADPINNVDPSGGWVFSAVPLIEHGIWTVAGSVAGTVIAGATSGWDAKAMKNGALIGGGIGLGASFVNWGSVGSALGDAGRWMGNLFQGSSVPWILYNGTKVTIYEGKEGNTKKSKVITESNGTSGYQQVAEAQTDRSPNNPGPTPEGDYKIDLTPDPNRIVSVDPESGGTNPGKGIEKLPSKVLLNGGQTMTYGSWGTIRARLQKDPGNKRIGGDNFYLHDSDKGYSHGCIEVSKSKIFGQLLKYRSSGIKSIRVKVKYPSPKTVTNGGSHGM